MTPPQGYQSRRAAQRLRLVPFVPHARLAHVP